MRIFKAIRAGKGNQDRHVRLHERTLLLRRQQWKSHRHSVLLLPAKGHGGPSAIIATEPMCRSMLQRAFRLALLASGVNQASPCP